MRGRQDTRRARILERPASRRTDAGLADFAGEVAGKALDEARRREGETSGLAAFRPDQLDPPMRFTDRPLLS